MSCGDSYYHVLDMWRVPTGLVSSNLQFPGSKKEAEAKADDILLKEYVVSQKGPFKENSLIEKAPMTFFEEVFVIFGLLIVLGGPLYWVMFGLYVIFYSSWINVLYYVFATIVLAFHPLPDIAEWTWKSKFVECLYKYFSYRFVWTGDQRNRAKKAHPFIGVGVPHGVLPFSNLLSIPAINAYLYGCDFKGSPASVVYRTPFLRYMTMLQTCDCGKESLTKELSLGYSVGLVGDGIAGIFTCSHDNEVVNLLHRKGIAKLALRTGRPVVACYSIGNTEAFTPWFDSFGIMESLSRKAQASIFFYWGRFFLPIPHRINIAMVMGDIIDVEQTDNPTESQINELHQKILDGIQSSFDKHKASLGWGHKHMTFI